MHLVFPLSSDSVTVLVGEGGGGTLIFSIRRFRPSIHLSQKKIIRNFNPPPPPPPQKKKKIKLKFNQPPKNRVRSLTGNGLS